MSKYHIILRYESIQLPIWPVTGGWRDESSLKEACIGYELQGLQFRNYSSSNF